MRCPHCWKEIDPFKPFAIVSQISKWEYNAYFHHKAGERIFCKFRSKKDIISFANKYGIGKSRITYEKERFTIEEWFKWLRHRELHYQVFK